MYEDSPATQLGSGPILPAGRSEPLPTFSLDDGYREMGPSLTNEDEDALLKVCF